jgi:hypothetical protein
LSLLAPTPETDSLDPTRDQDDPPLPPLSSQVAARAPALDGGEAVEPPPAAVTRAYQELQLAPGASLSAVESAYFKTKAELLRRGDRAALEPLKWAYETLKESLTQAAQTLLDQTATAFSPALNPTAALQGLLQERGLPAQVSLQASQLHLRWPAVRVANPKQTIAQVYTLLTQQDLDELGLGQAETLVVSGLNSHNQVVWRHTLAMPHRSSEVENTDLMSFHNRYSNGLVFPALLALGMVMNAMPIVNVLLQGIKIWLHEFGHATIAWLAGRQAMPLPLGWTSVNPQRSLGVYLGVLMLLGLLFWAGRREHKHWPMGLAVGLAVIQFAMTWMMSPDTFDMLLAFGGIGGELYLSALLMVSFYFPLPDYWRWDFYRYPVVLGAAFTFWGQFWLWKRIRHGGASIPFGSMWGDPSHGDMNILANGHGWTPGDIIGTYNGIANLSLLVLMGVYSYVLFNQHRSWFRALTQRWIARS